ncbi:FAD-binding protein [bacterium]|nr:FAD-binding protein [bacterium]
MTDALLVNDVTRLNPITVGRVMKPGTVEQVQQIIRQGEGRISIGGGRFSMGGQTALENSVHLDMRGLNSILEYNPSQKTIRVQAGIRWRDIQERIDGDNLSVKIMQTYANFTVGGSLSVNAHGRYIGLGPLILSVRSIALVLSDGLLVEASPQHNSDLFYGAIGGYGALGIIVEATLELADNVPMERDAIKLLASDYRQYFLHYIKPDKGVIFHNADIYPPDYTRMCAVTWRTTDKPVTVPHRLKPVKNGYWLERYFIWAFTETPFGKWRREHIIDPLLYRTPKIVWRNYEASYDVAELEPVTRKYSTYVLQEYFVPVGRFDSFLAKMTMILRKHRANLLNISVRHAYKDPGSIMAWAREEVYSFVIYYKQGTGQLAKERVSLWTRELIDAAIAHGGCYYLPYQPHATPAQFFAAYPRAREFFALKRRVDPHGRFMNKLLERYLDKEPV